MRNKKGLAITSFIILILLVFLIYKRNVNLENTNLLMAVYNKYDFDVLQISNSGKAMINTKNMNFDEMETVLQSVLESLDIRGTLDISKKENEIRREYTISRSATDSETTVTIESVLEEENLASGVSSYKTFLSINIILYGQLDGTMYIQKKLKEIYGVFNTVPTTNITMAGSYNEKFDSKETKKLAEKILKSIKATAINEYETERLYSVYGYTNLIKDNIKVQGDHVNVNVAIRFNEYEQKTYLYLASPVISVDY